MSIASVSLAANNVLIADAIARKNSVLNAIAVIKGITAQYDALTPTDGNVALINIQALTVAINAQVQALAEAIVVGTPGEPVARKGPYQ